MAFILADRVRETASAPGTGTVTLLGAVTGYQTFSAGIGASNTTYYVIADQSGANWEVGLGTIGAGGTTLARTTVLSSSNSGSLVNFSSGTQDVFCDYPAGQAVYKDSSNNVTGYAITGGTINNTVIGGTTPLAITGTTITATTFSGSGASLTNISASSISGQVAIANGGTNSTATPTAGSVGYGTGTAHAYTVAGTAGQVLQSNGASAPSWVTSPAAGAGGSTTQIQYNNAGVLAGNSTYTMVSGVMKENGYNFVSQADVGSAPNQIPLNQYLGSMAYQDTNSLIVTKAYISTLTTDGTVTSSYPVVSQVDVGLGANQVPLNQYLGSMAYQDNNGIQISGGTSSNLQNLANLFVAQPTPSAINASATLTVAQLLTRIITTNSATAVAFTLPTGTLTDAGILGGLLLVNQSFDWTIINTGSAVGIVTVSGGTANTLVGSGVLAITTSATFRTVKTATNTFITYRIA